MSLLHLGWSMAIITALYVGGGYLLDERWGTSPLWILVGTVLAFVSIGVMLWKISIQLEKE